jgi:hypothetical protein
MSKFTPGPWAVSQREIQEWDINAPRGDKRLQYHGWDGLAVVYGSDDDPTNGNIVGEANARLIAAAPDMHEALRQIVMLDDDARPGLFTWQEARAKAHEAARAVLAKVEG